MSVVALTVDMGASESISSDLLIGAAAIALYLFGSAKKRRKVYHLVRTSRMPHSYMGSQICARRSELNEWLRAK